MNDEREHTAWTSITLEQQSETSTSPPITRRPGRAARALLTTGLILALVSAPLASTNWPLWRREDIAAESSTVENEIDETLLEEVSRVFEQGSEELFIDGYSSTFSRRLLTLVEKHGRDAVRAITDHIFSGFAQPDVVSEALRWLSSFDDSSTLALRWFLLERTLRDPSSRVRDGSILGFAAMDDPRAIPQLDAARKREEVVELRNLIDKVRAQLTR